MHCTRKITNDIYWVGANDRRLALFENIFPIPRGVSYNSYLLTDEKNVLLDTVDFAVSRQFLENIDFLLQGKALDYLIINHMEPDHCALIETLAEKFPEMRLVCTEKAASMIRQFYTLNMDDRIQTVKEMDTLDTGKHKLTFLMAPFVHWPEVMVTYDATEKLLYSADAFGCFGALDGRIFEDELNFDRDWLDDARRYYTNIVGKYGNQVQALLKKVSALDVQTVCPLHGPVWRDHIPYFIEKYQKWSTYQPESSAVMIAYASMYGNTENAAEVLAGMLAEEGITDISVYDVSSTHLSSLVSEAFRCSHIVLACPTYNAAVYPVMETFLTDIKELNLQNRKAALIENGSWASVSGKLMTQKLETMKGMELLAPAFPLKSTLKAEQMADLKKLAGTIAASVRQSEQ